MPHSIKALLLIVVGVGVFALAGCSGGGSKTTTTTGPSGGSWTWQGGANVVNQAGSYGTLGTAAPGNLPGARMMAASWTDASGDFWLFGGMGYDSAGTLGLLNDLWEYSGGEWKWVGGSNLVNQLGTYGTQGIAAAGNSPGARSGASSWIDATGNLWLFGGGGQFCLPGPCFNDLWKYTGGQWTWVSGSNLPGQMGTYGVLGTAAPGNVPGARSGASSWIDASGSLWLFGGDDFDPGVMGGTQVNDLWKYSGGQWAWMGGANYDVGISVGAYGTKGTAAPGNVPGARSLAASWTDASGNLWLFGGLSNEGTGYYSQNDLWKYSGGEWTWMGGSDAWGQTGTYGTEGKPAPGNVPGARNGSTSWVDSSGNLWLFGGKTLALPGGSWESYNDLWKYNVGQGQWTWVSGSDVGNQTGIYGTQGKSSSSSVPGGREFASGWIDKSQSLWLFGGATLDPTSGNNQLHNDLWQYQP